MTEFLSYKNQSIDLQSKSSKSMDSFTKCCNFWRFSVFTQKLLLPKTDLVLLDGNFCCLVKQDCSKYFYVPCLLYLDLIGKFTGSYKSPEICLISRNMQKYEIWTLFRSDFMRCVLNIPSKCLPVQIQN